VACIPISNRVVRGSLPQHQAAFRIHLHCLSAPEVVNIAEVSGLSLRDTIQRLWDAGLDSIPGAGRKSWTTRCGSASAG